MREAIGAIISGSPVEKSSIIVTCAPQYTNASAILLPIKPAPPVIVTDFPVYHSRTAFGIRSP